MSTGWYIMGQGGEDVIATPLSSEDEPGLRAIIWLGAIAVWTAASWWLFRSRRPKP